MDIQLSSLSNYKSSRESSVILGENQSDSNSEKSIHPSKMLFSFLEYFKRIFNPTSFYVPKSIFSETTYRNMVFAIHRSRRWGALPFDYDYKNSKLIPSEGCHRKWVAISALQVIRCFSAIFSIVAANHETATIFDLAFDFFFCSYFCIVLIVMWNIKTKSEEFSWFINNSIKLFIGIRERYTNKLSKKWRNGCEELMPILKIAMLSLPYLYALNYVSGHRKALYWSSLFSSNSSAYPLVYLICGVSEFLLENTAWSSAMVMSFCGMGVVFTFVTIIKEIRPSRTIYRTKPNLRRPVDLRIFMRSCQLLGISVNLCFREVLMTLQSSIQYLCAVCAFIVIAFWSRLNFGTRVFVLFIFCLGTTIWSTVLMLGVMAFKQSEKSLNSWRDFKWGKEDRKIMKKFRKSCRPIQLELSGFYNVRPAKILTFWNTVLWLLLRALLTFNVH